MMQLKGDCGLAVSFSSSSCRGVWGTLKVTLLTLMMSESVIMGCIKENGATAVSMVVNALQRPVKEPMTTGVEAGHAIW